MKGFILMFMSLSKGQKTLPHSKGTEKHLTTNNGH